MSSVCLGRFRRSRLIFLSCLLFCCGSLLLGARAYAFSFIPMSVVVSDQGKQTVATVRITNDSAETIAVIVRVATRIMAEDGREVNEDVKDSFVVFPSRFVIPPGAQRALKLQWRGGPVGDTELAYRLIAEQVPVQFEKREISGISLLLKYIGTLYVRSAQARPADLSVVSVTGDEVEGVKGLILRLENKGGVHAILTSPVLSFQDGDSFVRLSGVPLEGVDGQNVLPSGKRKFFIPYERAVVGKSYDGGFSYVDKD